MKREAIPRRRRVRFLGLIGFGVVKPPQLILNPPHKPGGGEFLDLRGMVQADVSTAVAAGAALPSANRPNAQPSAAEAFSSACRAGGSHLCFCRRVFDDSAVTRMNPSSRTSSAFMLAISVARHPTREQLPDRRSAIASCATGYSATRTSRRIRLSKRSALRVHRTAGL